MPRRQGVRCSGFRSADGRFAHCTREERAGRLASNATSRTFAHRLDRPCACGVTHAGAAPAPARSALHSTLRARASACSGRVLREADFARCPKPYPCDYADASGAVLYRVARWQRGGEKSYSVHRPVPGGWASGRGSAPRVLYRLHDVLAAIRRGEVLHVVEGEKKAHALHALGLVATCNDSGAGQFTREHAESLRGARRVIVWADNDEPGKAHAQQAAQLLREAGVRDVRLPALPGLKHREGLDDWLARNCARASIGELRAELHRLAEDVKP
jgi:hypothetical protein